MLHERRPAASGDVASVIRKVRAGWRRRLIVRGLLRVLLTGAVVLIGAGAALEALRFTPNAILTFRIVTLAVIVGVTLWWVVRPFFTRVSDEQVALYLEEHEPSLNNLLLSAMSAERRADSPEHSPALVAKLVEEAIERVDDIESGRRVEQPLVKRYAVMALATAALAAAVFTLSLIHI